MQLYMTQQACNRPIMMTECVSLHMYVADKHVWKEHIPNNVCIDDGLNLQF